MKIVGVLTSGGDASGMSTTIRAVVRTATSRGLKVKGIMREYAGLLEKGIVDMESTGVPDIVNRSGTILHMARYKEFATTEDRQKGAGICRKRDTDGMVVIGGNGSFWSAGKLSALDIDTIGFPEIIDLDIAYTDYTIGFDTAVNVAMKAIDKIRNTSASHEWCGIVEVTGRNAGYITLWCGIGNDAEDIFLPERYGGNEQALTNRIIDNRRRGKEHNIIINAEGVGHSGSMAKRIEAATGIETRATILGHTQRGGTPTCKDRVYASIAGVKATGLLAVDKGNHLVAYKHGEFTDLDIQEALNMTKDIPEKQYEIAKMLIR